MIISKDSYNIYYGIGIGVICLLFLVAALTRGTSPHVQQQPTGSKVPHIRHITNEEAYDALKRLAKAMVTGEGTNTCPFKEYGVGWGAHSLCELKPSSNCKFVSFGIANDYSFDTDLATNAMCKGLALDPTVNHPAKLHSNVWFLAVGATSLKAPPESWIVTSVPSLLKWVKWDYIDVLKMDCEGCEYALARDILAEDPKFFERVGQFAIELHVSRVWINSLEPILNLGKLYLLMEESGMRLVSADIHDCHPDDEAPGCHEKLVELNYPCGPRKMCQNVLFAKQSRTTTEA